MMSRYLWLSLFILHSVLSQTTDKYSDEDRPYKFGFNIQGYQHRQEEKDERGLIKGEYGFITADGYYRVTVYATDENGDFRIISMKNYYVGFPPEDPTTTPGPPSQRTSNVRQPVSNPSFSSQPGPTGRALSVDPKPVKSTPRPQGLPACSDCSIPTTTTRTNQGNLIEDIGDFRSGRKETGAFGNDRTFGQGPSIGQSPQIEPRVSFQGPTGGQNSQFPQGPSRSGIQEAGPGVGQGPQFSQGSPSPGAGQSPQSPITGSGGNFGGLEGGRGSTPFGGDNEQNQGRPGSAPGGGAFTSGDSGFPRGRDGFVQNNQLDEGPRQRPRIGEVRDGLPPGVTVHDIKDLLYTFNYTVGFHGHHEDGYRNGDKEGDYFFDGRDGVERKVEYIANEFGYQPNITLIDLPENDVRRPNEQTEKEYGLKGYEFKWFYRK